MCMNIETSLKAESMSSKSFDVKVGVHQRSVLSPLLFAVVMDEMTKDIREGVVEELLYAHNLMVVGESWEEVASQSS